MRCFSETGTQPDGPVKNSIPRSNGIERNVSKADIEDRNWSYLISTIPHMGDTIQISGLESLISPEPVGGWPPAPGWFVVAGLVVLFLIAGIVLFIRIRRLNSYRRLALASLASLREQGEQMLVPARIHRLNYILKQTALQTYPRSRVASLAGSEWIMFLKESCPAFNLSVEQKSLLSMDGYRKVEEVPMNESVLNDLIRQIEIWIRNHRRGA